MSAHLTEKTFERLRLRTLPPDELLSADEHLYACEACRRRLAATADTRGMFSALREELTRDAATDEHLAYGQSEAYVEGALRGAKLEAAELHLAACRACADEVRELSELRESLNATHAPFKQAATVEAAPPARANAHESVAVETRDAPTNNGRSSHGTPRPTRRGLRAALAAFTERHLNFSPQWAAAAAAFLLLASLSAWWLASAPSPASRDEIARQSQSNSQPQQINSQTQTNSQQPTVAPTSATPASTPTALPNPTAEHVGSQAQPSNAATPDRNADANRNADVNRGANKSGNADGEELASVPPQYRDAVRRALKTNVLTEPGVLAEVRSAPRTLLGGARAEDTFALETPAGVVTRSDRPAFRWRPLRDAEAYTVKVYDADFNLVASSPQLSAAEWTPAAPLARGRVYAWQVTAKRNGEEIVAPAPPAPEARFSIVSRAQDESLTRAERDARASHLALAVLYARAGLLRDAERELDAHLRASPRSAAARGSVIWRRPR
ncbi:MAG TPA: hypothetical protein VM936_09285 [Pyrinomonadaceae bacterium]|nr:hypothetical protein [Pyrinomonadaceae bacterium]